jgi:hypothetical protein
LTKLGEGTRCGQILEGGLNVDGRGAAGGLTGGLNVDGRGQIRRGGWTWTDGRAGHGFRGLDGVGGWTWTRVCFAKLNTNLTKIRNSLVLYHALRQKHPKNSPAPLHTNSAGVEDWDYCAFGGVEDGRHRRPSRTIW